MSDPCCGLDIFLLVVIFFLIFFTFIGVFIVKSLNSYTRRQIRFAPIPYKEILSENRYTINHDILENEDSSDESDVINK